MFVTIFLAVWTALNLYVCWRIASIPAITRHTSPYFFIAIGAVLWATIFLYRFVEGWGAPGIARFIELVAMSWLGVLFLLFTCFLVVDLATGFGLFFRPLLPSLRAGALATGIVLSAIAFVQARRPPVVNDYEVHIANLPPEDDGLVIAVISDLHVGALLDGEWLSARVAQVNALRPDMVLMLGDLFEGDSDRERQSSMVVILRGLSAPLGVWGVTGNHESYAVMDSNVRFFEESGIQMLRNRWNVIRPGLAVGGIDDPGHFGSSPAGDNGMLREVLAGKPDSDVTILLSHRPQGAEKVAKAGVSLMLSGHTHGGQIWPFTYIAGLFNPLMAGRYDVNGMPVIVCRGTGTWGPRMRLWAPSEIICLTLRAE